MSDLVLLVWWYCAAIGALCTLFCLGLAVYCIGAAPAARLWNWWEDVRWRRKTVQARLREDREVARLDALFELQQPRLDGRSFRYEHTDIPDGMRLRDWHGGTA